jgi:hypothetical protein
MFVPLRGADVGTWDIPMNGNFNALDFMLGGVTTYTPTNAPITMASTAAQAAIIRLTGTLTGNVAITMANIFKFWTIDNQLTNASSGFVVTFVSTSGSQQVGAPPGSQDIYYDGTNVRYRTLPHHVGGYWDYAGNTVPNWVTACTVPPYLNCDGTTFSSAVYPVLAGSLGGNTLPDSKGRYRAVLNQGSGRLTTNSSNGAIDGNTLLATGGAGGTTILSSHVPAHAHPITDPGHFHTLNGFNNALSGGSQAGSLGGASYSAANSASNTTGITVNNSTGANQAFSALGPTYMGGITMIRAA